jgi:hypothetical protein
LCCAAAGSTSAGAATYGAAKQVLLHCFTVIEPKHTEHELMQKELSRANTLASTRCLFQQQWRYCLATAHAAVQSIATRA